MPFERERESERGREKGEPGRRLMEGVCDALFAYQK